MFTNVRQGDIILCQDGNYTDYINKIYGADAVWFPPAGNYSGPYDDEGRTLDIVLSVHIINRNLRLMSLYPAQGRMILWNRTRFTRRLRLIRH